MLFHAMTPSGLRWQDHADAGRVLQIRIGSEIAEVALPAHRRVGVALGPLRLLPPLARHFMLAERREAVAREGREERDHVVDLRLGEPETLHAAVEVRIG